MFRALVSFSGIISMAQGEVKDIKDQWLIDDLTRAGYIEKVVEERQEIKEAEPVEKPAEPKPAKKKTTKKK